MNNKLISITCVACLAATFIVWSGCDSRADLETSRQFQQAQEEFDSAVSPDDFLRAASIYQEILDSGTRCGAVYYNQGNAYMQAGNAGQGIAAYRQAKQFMPNDPYLEANLAYALGTENSTMRKPLIEHILFWQNWISYPAKLQWATLFAVITVLVAIAGLFRSKPFTPVAITCLGVTLLVCGSAMYDWNRFERTEHGVVIAQETVARKGNSPSYEPAFNEALYDGTEFQVTAHRGSWIRLQLADGQEGWIPQSDAVVY